MKVDNTLVRVDTFSKEYYSFEKYNSKIRMLTYWHQISEILKTNASDILEIGVGSGLVTNYLRYLGLNVKTADINQNLSPDFHTSVLELGDDIGVFDLIVCCRVLHHIKFDDFEIALERIRERSRKFVIITLPVDEVRVYFMTRVTSSALRTSSLRLPLFIKRAYSSLTKKAIGSGLWQINSSKETSLNRISFAIAKYFKIIHGYQLPEDKSHFMFVLEKK